MKKSAIAMAVLGSLATASYAQNVSLYGVADAGAVSSNATTSAGKVSQVGLVSGGHSTTRFGLRGTEDLGGGLRAHFGFEAGVAIDTGAVGGPTGATGGRYVTNTIAASNQQIFNRGAFVGVEGAFGRVNAGKISTPGNAWLLSYTPGSANHDAISMRAGVYGTASQMATWRDNTIEYVSPAFNGLQLRVGQTLGNTTQNSTTATSGNTGSEGITTTDKEYGKGQDITLSYTMGPLNLGAFTSAINLSSSGTVKEKATGLGAAYTFGNVRAGMSINTYDPSDTATNDKRKLTAFGVNVPMSSALGLRASLGDLKIESSSGDLKTRFLSLGADYSLSKRTAAYAFYTRADNSAGATQGLLGTGAGNSQIAGTPSAGTDVTVAGIGVRHSF